MRTATIRIPEDKINILKAISNQENKKMTDMIVELIDEYSEKYKETLELLSIPGLHDELIKSKKEFREGKAVAIKDIRKELE